VTAFVIIGTAFAYPFDGDPGVRWYKDAEGVSYIGHETNDIEYFCSDFCLDLELASQDLAVDRDTLVLDATRHVSENGTITITTLDIERNVVGDMPDYDVACHHCGDSIHRVTPV
jgi:hypothetical protein